LALVALLLAAGLAAACGEVDGGEPLGPEPEPSPPPPVASGAGVTGADITGTVTQVTPVSSGDVLATLLIEAARADGAFDLASVTVTGHTDVYQLTGETSGSARLARVDGAALDWTSLEGRVAAVAFVGPVAESYPVQARAAWVVLLPAPHAD
jgi:hypothetical protein